jgi:hypothetical protein
MPIILPQQKTWKWEKVKISTNAKALNDYYKDDDSRREKLWSPDPYKGGKVKKVQAPLLLFISLVLFNAIQAKRRPLMPQMIHNRVLFVQICHYKQPFTPTAPRQV